MAGVETGEGLGVAGEGAVNPVAVDELWHLADPEVREAALEAQGIDEAYRALDEEEGVESTIGDPTVPFGRGVVHQLGSRRQRIRDSVPGRAAREQAMEQAIAEAKALGQKGRVRELTAKNSTKKDEKFVPKPRGKYLGRCALGPGEAARILKEEHGIHDVQAQDLSLAELQERIGFDEPEAQTA